MITQDEAIQMARDLGIGLYTENDIDVTYKELTAFANAVRRKTLLEAADWADNNTEITGNGWSCHLRRMADEPHVP